MEKDKKIKVLKLLTTQAKTFDLFSTKDIEGRMKNMCFVIIALSGDCKDAVAEYLTVAGFE